MFVIIAGGGRTGAQLASLLLKEGHQVRLVEHRPELLAYLHRELPTECLHEGLPLDPAVMEAAGLRQANVLAATTHSDADNLVICYMAREMFKVPRIIARINNPRNTWLFDKKFHVDVAVCQADVLAHLIQEEMSLGDMMTLLKLRRGRYSLVEEKIPLGAKGVGIAIKDLGLPEQCVIAAIIRHGKVTLPRGTTTFEPGDEVLAITDEEGARFLADLFAPPSRPARIAP
ncbi:MAG: NAD-binding protein [Anaerolineales bacterium]|nr:NAD-binding protein [Anaerolineales bacterium]MDW8226246.1 NAD-binding protein [Anaerolineales bacterium]